jgi:hypothetical protein
MDNSSMQIEAATVRYVRLSAAAFAHFVIDEAHGQLAAEGGAVLAGFVEGRREASLAELERHSVAAKSKTPTAVTSIA